MTSNEAVLNVMAAGWLEWMAPMFWQVSVVVLAVLLVSLVARKASPRFRYLLWGLVFVKLCLPPGLSFVTGVVTWLPVREHVLTVASVEQPAPPPALPAATVELTALPVASVPVAEAAPLPESDAAVAVPARRAFPLPKALLAAWMLGVLGMAGVLLWQYARLAHLLSRATPVRNPDLLAVLQSAQEALAVRQRVELLAAPDLPSPILFGSVRPRIAMPADALRALTPVQLKAVLLHELTHLKRHDLWVNWLQVALQTLYWFHPLVWLAAARLRAERELIVDDTVLWHLGAEREAYGSSMLAIVKQSLRRHMLAPGCVGIIETRGSLGRRLKRILDGKRKLSLRIGGLSLAVLVAVALLVIPQTRAQRAAAGEPAAGGPAVAALQPAPQGLLQKLIAAAPPGGVVSVPPGIYTAPVLIDRPLTLKGEDPQKCIFELTADEPCVVVSSREPVTIDSFSFRWQLATSVKAEAPACALAVKDGKASIRNCRFIALGNATRCPSAVQCLGFSKVNLTNCAFEGFEYTVNYSDGAEGAITDCVVLNPGHCGITVYAGSKLEVARTIVTGSGYHGIRSTGGTLLAHDNLIINNKNRGFYLGNRSATGRLSNNVILGNGAGISAFAQTDVTVENNVILRSSFAGLDARDSCPITVRNNIFQENATGVTVFAEAGKNRVILGRNSFWRNAADTQNIERPGDSILADPRFRAADQGDFSAQAEELKTAGQGLSDPGVFRDLWKKWNSIAPPAPKPAAGAPSADAAAAAAQWVASDSPAEDSRHALRLDGLSNYVEVPDSPSLDLAGPLTVEAWIRFEVGGDTNPRIISKGWEAQTGYEMAVYGTGEERRLAFLASAAELGRTYSNALLNAGKWNHVAATFDGTNVSLYVNGGLDVSRNVSGGAAPLSIPANDAALNIGRNSQTARDMLKGSIDEVRIWSTARSPEDIRRDMSRRLTGNEPGLVAYWRFEEGEGDVVHDSTPNGNNGRLSMASSPQVR